MMWPWISRTAYEAKCSEVQHLRAELAAWNDHARRMERKSAGMPEAPPQRREAPPPMPKGLRDWLDGWETMRPALERRAHDLYRRTGSWAEVEHTLKQEQEA